MNTKPTEFGDRAGTGSPVGAAIPSPEKVSIEQALGVRLREMREKLRTSENVLENLSRTISNIVRENGLNAFDADAARIVDIVTQFHVLASQLLDPARAKERCELGGDLAITRRSLRHDLANPLGAILAFAELMQDDAQSGNESELNSALQKLIVAVDTSIADLDIIIDFGSLAGSTDVARVENIAPSREDSRKAIAPKTGLARRLGDGALEMTMDGVRLLGDGALILVVDDAESNRELLARHLTRLGHRVVNAATGAEAIELVEQMKFDLVLLDLILPDISGYDVLRHLKQRDGLRNIPVLIISAINDEDDIARCIEAGAEDYLSKPINPVILRARIASGLERNRSHAIQEKLREDLEAAKDKFEALLLNILPQQIVDRLSQGETIADQFDDVTVLFGDIVGFTELSSRRSPRQVVEMLNAIFVEFDSLALRLGIEKIKTIGDAYLVASGLPIPRHDHADAIANMALGMKDILHRLNSASDQPIKMRIGIASGPVMAGIIGTHKYVYDIWGDTVNTAARHESYGSPDHIHIDKRTAELLAGRFRMTSRGILNMRGLGAVETYFLDGPI
jgi:adenylate cyclase